jgi:uncharacterized membrane protein
MTDVQGTPPATGDNSKNLTMVVYALQAASFVFGITWFVAVVINYVKLDDVRGSWLESHFRWQIRTFWFGLLWCVVGAVLTIVLIGWAILFASAVWVIYRIVKGWLNLAENRPV